MANSFATGAASGSGAATAGAIVGDNQTPYSCSAFVSSGDNLTTGDLSVGDAGEMGGLASFAVEFWFQANGALPGATSVIVRGPVSADVGQYQYFIQFISTNVLQFVVRDDAGTVHSLSGATALRASVWYHVVCTAEGGLLRIYLNGVQDSSDATWGSHTVRTRGSAAGSLDLQLQQNYAGVNLYFDEVATYRTGLTAVRVAAHYDAGVNKGWRFQNSGTRIIAILDVMASSAPRSIQTGARSVIPRYMSGSSPLEEIRRAVEAEDVDAAFFVKADGTLTFLADGHRSSSPYNTIQATFGDGAGELAYVDVAMDYSETFLINEWNVTRTAYQQNTPVTQTVSDATSISRYFKRSQSLSDVPVLTDADASTIATELLAKYKDPMQRITSISFNTIDAGVTEALFRRELMDKIRILRTPPGGGSRIQQDVFIQKIDIQGTNDGHPWTITWGVSPL